MRAGSDTDSSPEIFKLLEAQVFQPCSEPLPLLSVVCVSSPGQFLVLYPSVSHTIYTERQEWVGVLANQLQSS